MSGRKGKEYLGHLLLFSSVIAIYALDRISKILALHYLQPGESIPLVKNVLHLTLVYNPGAAFGIFKDQLILLSIITILSIAFIAYLLLSWHKKGNLVEKMAFGFILAGAMGNLTDRLKVGYVVDFIDFRVWPVFNIADSFITIGVCLIVIIMWRRKTKALKGTRDA